MAFFAEAAGWGDWYIGSVLVPPMPPGASVPVSVDWDTTGFSGEVPVKAVVNPYARTAETSTGNNSSSTTVTVSPAAVDFAQAMPANWNLISFPVEPESAALADVLSSIAGSHGLVYAYNGCDAGDPWRSYNPSAPPYVNDLSEMTPGLGYWIRAESNCTWTVGE